MRKRSLRDYMTASPEQREAWLKEQAAVESAALRKLPRTKVCAVHGPGKLELDEKLTREQRGVPQAWWEAVSGVYVCRDCEAERREQSIQSTLRSWNVPDNLLHCALGNWTPSEATEAGHLDRVVEFSK